MKNQIIWGRIAQSGSDADQFATQKIEYLGKLAETLMVFPYGLHGNVPADNLGLLFAVQENTDNRACIGWTPTDRPTLADGEVAFYHPPTDAFIIFRSSGKLEIETGGNGAQDIDITASNVNIIGNVNITGDVGITGDTDFTGTVRANGKVIDDTHGHVQGNDGGGDAEQAISGVT